MTQERTSNKKSHSDKKVDSSHPKVRIEGQKGSWQNKLRGKLYASGFQRIEESIESKFFIEAISICDSMITDRLMAYTQTLLHKEPKQYITNGLYDALMSFSHTTKETNIRDNKQNDGYRELYKKIEDWIQERNTCVHNYVIVDKRSLDADDKDRELHMNKTALEGYQLVREVMKYTDKVIEEVKKNPDIIKRDVITRPTPQGEYVVSREHENDDDAYTYWIRRVKKYITESDETKKSREERSKDKSK